MSSSYRFTLLAVYVSAAMLLGCIPKFDRSSQCTTVADCFKGERCDVIRGCVLVDDSGADSMDDGVVDLGAMDMTAADAEVDQGTVDGETTDASQPGDAIASDTGAEVDATGSDLGATDAAVPVDEGAGSADDGTVSRDDSGA